MKSKKTIHKDAGLALKQGYIRHARIWTLILAALLLVCGYYLIYPQYQAISSGGQYDIAALESEREKRQEYIDRLEVLLAEAERIGSEEIEKIADVLPHSQDIPGLYVQLESIAEENNFELVSVSMSDEAAAAEPTTSRRSRLNQATSSEPTVKRLGVSVNLLGDNYGAFKRLLEVLEANVRLFDVNSVFFAPDSDSYSLNFFTYYLE